MEKEKIQKPLTVALEDAKLELIQAINEISNKNGLTFFFLELIVGDIYKEIVEKKTQEATEARLKYNEEIEKNRKEDNKWKKLKNYLTR